MSWQDKLYELDTQEKLSLDVVEQSSQEAKKRDIGLINENSGAGILVRENGRMEGFSDYGLGFRFDPDTQSLSIFAPHIRLFTKDIQQIHETDDLTYFTDEYKDVLDLLNEGDTNASEEL